MGKHFIDPKSSEILSIFQVFPCTTQIALFWPKLLPALFLKKPWYPCPFEILAEALSLYLGWVIILAQSFTFLIINFTSTVLKFIRFFLTVRAFLRIIYCKVMQNISKEVQNICDHKIFFTVV
jgi:hypothetical protein